MVYPGTINWHQGLDIAVKAFALIKHEIPQLYFHIYGSGTHLKEISKLIHQLKLQDRIFLHPGKPLREIAKIVAKADFGIIPKRNDQFGGEAFSTKTLEFMASGVPIIVSKTKIDQYYFDESMVKFFEPENVEALADAIRDLVSDSSLRNRLSRNGYEFAMQNAWSDKKIEYLGLINCLCTKN